MKPSKQFRDIGQRDAILPENMGFRSLEVRSSTFNVDARSVEATISTETPVAMPDYGRGEMVNEVLMSSGMQMPKSRQVPFLDSHSRYSIKDQLGSARSIEVKDGSVSATLMFSKASHAEDAMSGVRDGHITDVSVGYEVLKRVYVPAGESKSISGRQFDGPVNVVTKWRLREVSLTPIGADAQAKLRGLDPAAFPVPFERAFKMNEELRKLLVSRGMAETLTDEEAQKWLIENRSKLADPAPAPTPVITPAAPVFDEARMAALIVAETNKAIVAEATRQAALRSEIDSLCGLADLPEAAEHCRSLGDIAAVRTYLTAETATRIDKIGYAPNITVGGTGQSRLLKDMGTALTLRAMSASGRSDEAIAKVFPVAERGAGATTFRHASLFQMAEEFVRSSGLDTRGLTREQVAICAMFGPDVAGVRSNSGGAAYNTTGSFTNLTLDAVNKAMMIGYTEAPATWRGPMRQAMSVPDFKNINRIRMGAIPNLPVWNDNTNPERASFSDAKEVYAVESRSLEINFSYKLLVNDDMDAISRVPAMMGAAASRTVNAVAWAQFTSNPTMADGVALFATATGARKRTNLTSGAGAPSVTTLQTLSNLMRQMRGENTPEGNESADILNLSPRFIIGPSALDTTIKQLVLSAYDPSANTFQVYNTASQLIPVIEPLLDVASTTAWFLAADPSQIDTVEVSFLQGQETPVTRQFMDDRNLSQNFIILQTFAAKALNHRGLQRHAGA